MRGRPRRNHTPAFKAKAALAAVRVVPIWPDGRVQYETRSGPLSNARTWSRGCSNFAISLPQLCARGPYDRTPEREG